MVYRNEEAYNDLWYWINERHQIHLKKEAGEPAPWTTDPILQEWKFCNPFRVNDRETRNMMAHIGPHLEEAWHTHEGVALVLFNIFAFRAFNWTPTYEGMVKDFGKNGWLETYSEVMGQDSAHDSLLTNGKLTSSAYMMRGYEGQPKWVSIPRVLQSIWNWRRYAVKTIQDEPITTMEEMQKFLVAAGFWGWGLFSCYQIVLDMTYTRFLADACDINSWCEFGPGAKRGIRWIWPGAQNSGMLERAQFLFEEQSKHLGSHVPEMTIQDIEFSLCELSKYERIKHGGRSKERYASRS